MKKISKLLIVVGILFLVVGCGNMMDTPTKKVEEFLNKYQSLDEDVLDQLDDTMIDANSFNENQKDKYYELMKRQYKNLDYKIKDEKEDGKYATVTAEIEVLDYGKAINESEMYLTNNKEVFIGKDSDTVDNTKFLEYKISEMEKVKEKVTYTINFKLEKVDDKWELQDIDDIDRLKLHGLYY